MTRIAIPAFVVMLTMVSYVGMAGWNAAGEPVATIALSERELAVERWMEEGSDTGAIRLRLMYHARVDPLDARNWLTEDRLREIGFSLHIPAGSPQAIDAYDHVPARFAWVALELDGPQWRARERRLALDASGRPPLHEASRLVPVDASLDLETLRRRYPSGHLFARGVIGLSYVDTPGGGRMIAGWLRELVPQQLSVPRRFRDRLAGGGRYEVIVALGRAGFPYVQSVR